MTQPPPDTETVKAFNDKIAAEFRANNGKVGAFEGTELLLLTTTGAKSGQPRLSPLSCRRVDGKLLIIAGYGGADINPAWVHNLRADPARMSNWPMSRSMRRRANCRPPSAPTSFPRSPRSRPSPSSRRRRAG